MPRMNPRELFPCDQLTSICSAASADSQSPLNGPGSRQSASPKSTHTPQRSYPNTGQACRTTETSETSEESRATSSQEDFLASHSAAPGSDGARQMTVISGRKCSALSQRQDPLGCLERTLLASSTWNSTLCFLTWKASATPQGRLLFQLAVSMPATGETESGLWLTPSTEDHKSDGPAAMQAWSEAAAVGKRPAETYQRLRNQVLFPTPTSRDHKDGTARSCANVPVNGLLGRTVHLMPTPTGNRRDGLQSHGVNVVSGSLNPNFVEWLMGYPKNWTEV